MEVTNEDVSLCILRDYLIQIFGVEEHIIVGLEQIGDMAAVLIVPFEKKHGFNRQITITVLKPLLQDISMGFTLYFNPVVLQWDVNNELRKFTNCPKTIYKRLIAQLCHSVNATISDHCNNFTSVKTAGKKS